MTVVHLDCARKSRSSPSQVTLIVTTTTDPASIGPAKALLSQAEWQSGPRIEGLSSWKSAHGVRLWQLETRLIHEDLLDKRWEQQTGEVVSEVIFLSKHVAASSKPALTLHPIGIPHLSPPAPPPAGGFPGWCAPPCPRIGPWLRLLQGIAKERGLTPEFEVCLEATHHGPTVLSPAMFVEIGSTQEQWGREDAAQCIAELCVRGLGLDGLGSGLGTWPIPRVRLEPSTHSQQSAHCGSEQSVHHEEVKHEQRHIEQGLAMETGSGGVAQSACLQADQAHSRQRLRDDVCQGRVGTPPQANCTASSALQICGSGLGNGAPPEGADGASIAVEHERFSNGCAPAVLLGIGGGHYVPRHFDVGKRDGVWLGHLICGYSLPMEEPGTQLNAPLNSAPIQGKTREQEEASAVQGLHFPMASSVPEKEELLAEFREFLDHLSSLDTGLTPHAVGGRWREAILRAFLATQSAFPGGNVMVHLDSK